jgi:hypothetical protein
MEAIAEIAAIGLEHDLDTPIFAHLVQYPMQDENIVLMPGGGYGLIVPPGETEEFVTRTVCHRTLKCGH